MRRFIGPTGSPQAVLPIATSLAPLLDLTGQDVQAVIKNRTVFVDLWVYLPSALPLGNVGNPMPSFWTAQSGLTPIQEASSTDQRRKGFVLTGLSNDLQTTLLDPSRRIAAEMTTVSTNTTLINALDASIDTISVGVPTHVLRRFPISGPFALWLIHNWTSNPYVWGYYTIQGDDESLERLRRPLQPSLTSVLTEYLSVRALSDAVPVTVHQVGNTFTDEVTLDLRKISAAYGTSVPNGGAAGVVTLNFENPGKTPVNMPVWDGGDVNPGAANGTYQPGAALRRWLDGIPMRGAGKIQVTRAVGATTLATSARGSFLRY